MAHDNIMETGTAQERLGTLVTGYFSKWKGEYSTGPGKFPSALFVLISGLGGFCTLGVMSVSSYFAANAARDWIVNVGSFGAMAVLVFAAPAGPFSQPRNVIGGNLVSSIVGVCSRVWIAQPLGNDALALPFSCFVAYLLMHLTRTVNPPAGGTTALLVISSPSIEDSGWMIIISSVLWGLVFVLMACIFINLIPGQKYPKYWFVDHSAIVKSFSSAKKKTDVDHSSMPGSFAQQPTAVVLDKTVLTKEMSNKEQLEEREVSEVDQIAYDEESVKVEYEETNGKEVVQI